MIKTIRIKISFFLFPIINSYSYFIWSCCYSTSYTYCICWRLFKTDVFNLSPYVSTPDNIGCWGQCKYPPVLFYLVVLHMHVPNVNLSGKDSWRRCCCQEKRWCNKAWENFSRSELEIGLVQPETWLIWRDLFVISGRLLQTSRRQYFPTS